MNEQAMIIYVALAGAAFAEGGTVWKGFRRFGLPIITGVFLWTCGLPILKIALSVGLLTGVLHLGYGVKHPWWPDKTLVAVSYAIPTVLIGLTVWQLILPIAFLGMFWGSNHVFQDDFRWKVVELFAGFMIAATYIGAVARGW